MITCISNNITSFFTAVQSFFNSLCSRVYNLSLKIFSKKDDLTGPHYKFKASLKTFLENGKTSQKTFVFTEQQLLKNLEALGHENCIYLINGPNLLERLPKEREGFKAVDTIDGLAITHNTKIDLLRTPIELTKKNKSTYKFGSLNQIRDLETQIKELKTRLIESLGDTPESLKITAIAINCIHQEQIKVGHAYLSKMLPVDVLGFQISQFDGHDARTPNSDRLFSIIINQDGSILIKERLTTKLKDMSRGTPKNLGLSAICSYDYKICKNGDIENSTHSIELLKDS